MNTTDNNWSLVLKPKRKLLDIPIKEVLQYKDLIWLFIKRDFTTQYKQTILGPLWFIITPLVSTVMYSFVFGNLAKIGTDGIPHILFYYAGTMLWTFFTGCFTDASNIFVNNQHIFSKVYFPRLTVPISNVAGNLTKALVQFACLMCFFIYYCITLDTIKPSFLALAFPVIFLWIALIATGMGMIVSALTTKYKDLRILVSFALGLAMYATPVVYPLSQIPGKLLWIAYINPLSAPIELFRIWFYGAGTLPTPVVISSIAQTFFWIFLGLIMFNKNEQSFVDVF